MAEKTEAAKIREWAASRGISVGSRGRIPADVTDQYKAATGQ